MFSFCGACGQRRVSLCEGLKGLPDRGGQNNDKFAPHTQGNFGKHHVVMMMATVT